jgi:hypothetical protein
MIASEGTTKNPSSIKLADLLLPGAGAEILDDDVKSTTSPLN